MSASKFSAREMRDALSKFATGVTIVTTSNETGQSIGMTASSFNSVSMDPPLVLWSVTKSAWSAPAFKNAKHFAIHVLSAGQKEISNRFARQGEDKFNGLEYTLDKNNIPLINNALVRFDCETWAVYEGGDHWIIVGKVIDLDACDGEGLVFCNGSYATASAMRANEAAPTDGYSKGSPIEDLLIYHLSRAYRQFGDGFHDAVRESGMSVAEWRILASLQGKAARSGDELSKLTFIDLPTLNDMLDTMQSNGLCAIDTSSAQRLVRGTDEGRSRVEHLFSLAKKQEHQALKDSGDKGMQQLIILLDEVAKNTSR